METNTKDKLHYQKRWDSYSGTRDEDILSLEYPKSKVSFFYSHYNKLILNL